MSETLPAVIDQIEPQSQPERDAWGFLQHAIATLGDLVQDNSTDLDGLARTQALAARMKHEIDLLVEVIRPYLWDAMGEQKELYVEGVGLLKKDFGASRSQWQHDEIWHDIELEAVRRCVDDNGEVIPTVSAIRNTIALVRAVVSKGSYKSTGIRAELGREPDEYAITSWGSRKVVILGAPATKPSRELKSA